jgi:hypothetical protein
VPVVKRSLGYYNKLAKIPSAGTPGKVMREERQRNQLGSGEKERERADDNHWAAWQGKKAQRSFCRDSKPEFSRKEETQSLARLKKKSKNRKNGDIQLGSQ